MRVEFLVETSARELQRHLNARIENYDDDKIEIQYQHSATYTGYSWLEIYSAMVIFK